MIRKQMEIMMEKKRKFQIDSQLLLLNHDTICFSDAFLNFYGIQLILNTEKAIINDNLRKLVYDESPDPLDPYATRLLESYNKLNNVIIKSVNYKVKLTDDEKKYIEKVKKGGKNVILIEK